MKSAKVVFAFILSHEMPISQGKRAISQNVP